MDGMQRTKDKPTEQSPDFWPTLWAEARGKETHGNVEEVPTTRPSLFIASPKAKEQTDTDRDTGIVNIFSCSGTICSF